MIPAIETDDNEVFGRVVTLRVQAAEREVIRPGANPRTPKSYRHNFFEPSRPHRRRISTTAFGEVTQGKYARQDLNLQPLAPEANALSN